MQNQQRVSMLACALGSLLPYAREEAARLDNVVRRDGAEEAEFEIERATAAIQAAEQLLDGEASEVVYRLLVVHGDVEPELLEGEHASFEDARAAARAFRRQEGAHIASGCYVIKAPRGCLIEVEAFSGADMEDGGDGDGDDGESPRPRHYVRDDGPQRPEPVPYVLFSAKAAMASQSRAMPGNPATGSGYWSTTHGWTRIANADVHKFAAGVEPFPPLPDAVKSETDDAVWIPRNYHRTHTCFHVRLSLPDGTHVSRSLWARTTSDAMTEALRDYPYANVVGILAIA